MRALTIPRANVVHHNPKDPGVHGEEQEAADEEARDEGAQAEELEPVGLVQPECLSGGGEVDVSFIGCIEEKEVCGWGRGCVPER